MEITQWNRMIPRIGIAAVGALAFSVLYSVCAQSSICAPILRLWERVGVDERFITTAVGIWIGSCAIAGSLAALLRFPKGIRLVQEYIDVEHVRAKAVVRHRLIARDLEFVADALKRTMQASGFYIVEAQTGPTVYFWTEKHRLNRLGPTILMLGVCAVTIGMLAGRFVGFEYPVTLVPGSQAGIANTPYTISYRNFDIAYYANSGVPKRIRSIVEIADTDGILSRGTIAFGRPLAFGPLRLYHGQYEVVLQSARLSVRIPRRGREETRPIELTARFDADTPVSGTPYVVRLERFSPNYASGAQGVYSRSPQWVNPAVEVGLYDRGSLIGRDWLFERAPEVARNSATHTVPYDVRLIALESAYATTFVATSRPIAEIVWVGFALSIVGSILACWLVHRTVDCIITRHERGTDVLMGGTAGRDLKRFGEHLDRILDILETT